MRKCPECQFENNDANKFCIKCGRNLTESFDNIFCDNCGAKLGKEMLFCPKCGKRIANISPNLKSGNPDKSDVDSGFEDYDENKMDRLQKLAESGDAVSAYLLGMYYYGTEIDKSVKWLSLAAHLGDLDAQFELGQLYYIDDDLKSREERAIIPCDEGKAFKLFEKAALQGHAEAQTDLGFCYQNGTGTSRDDEAGFEWFQKSALQGNAEAQYELGQCYLNGRGVEKNLVLARQWNHKAAIQGYECALDTFI